MKQTMRKILLSIAALGVVVATGCDSSVVEESTTTNVMAVSDQTVLAGPEARATGSATTVVTTVVPTPFNDCTGAGDERSVQRLAAEVGVVLARADIAPLSNSNQDGIVEVSDFKVLAGTLPNGPIKTIRLPVGQSADQADVHWERILPQGNSVILLGAPIEGDGEYVLVGGQEGTFEIAEGAVRQRCANYQNPDEPRLAPTTVPLNRFIALFSQVFEEYPAPPPAPAG